MKKSHYIVALFVIGVTAVAGTASAAIQQYTFDRYQPILDRLPFGEIQPEQAPSNGKPVPTAPPFTKNIKMCAITEDDSGIQVGFVDVGIKPPKSYLLRVGEREDDIALVRADYGRETALLKKGEDEEWISMAGSGDSDISLAATMAAPTATGPPPLTAAPLPSGRLTKETRRMSYAERLRQRREANRVRNIEAPKLEGEALKKHLEEYQMELIRKGMPALPMQLTPEMDAKLVEEGVLPAVEEVEVEIFE